MFYEIHGKLINKTNCSDAAILIHWRRLNEINCFNNHLKILTMNKVLLSFFCYLTFTSPFIAKEKKFSIDEMRADLDNMYAVILDIHPDMFAFMSKNEFEKYLLESKSELKDSMNIFEFYNIAARLAARLGDGHTSAYFPMRSLTEPHIKLFPFSIDLNYRDSTVFIRNDFSDPKSGIPQGAEIISINGRDIRRIVGEMLACRSGEKLHYRSASLISQFGNHLHSLYADTVFTISYRESDMQKEMTVKGLDYHTRYRPVESGQTPRVNYSLTLDKDRKVAIIHFNQFHDFDRFKVFIDSAFTVIRDENIRDLIIDIRRNGGGRSDIGDEFFQYISPVPFQQFGGGVVKISDRVKESRLKDFGYLIEDENGIRPMNTIPLIDLRENPLRFTGNIYLLTSHFTFSSAGSFSWAFRYFNMGTIVGEETGGLAVCFGDVIPQTMPNTGLMIGVSYKKFYQWGATDENIHGTLPHHEIESEKAFEHALFLIEQNRKQELTTKKK